MPSSLKNSPVIFTPFRSQSRRSQRRIEHHEQKTGSRGDPSLRSSDGRNVRVWASSRLLVFRGVARSVKRGSLCVLSRFLCSTRWNHIMQLELTQSGRAAVERLENKRNQEYKTLLPLADLEGRHRLVLRRVSLKERWIRKTNRP